MKLELYPDFFVLRRRAQTLIILISLIASQGLNAQDNPAVACVAEQIRNTDSNNCTYTIQGTEFDPVSVTDDNNDVTSLNYSLQKLEPNPTLISENFSNLSWNATNFEIGSPTGSAATGAYLSAPNDDRGTLRTVNDFVPTAQNPLYVSARLTFSDEGIAFIGTRSTGLKVSGASNEPANSLYLRIHNFADGFTNLAPEGIENNPGDAFYANPVIVSIIDNGSNIAVTLTNTVTNQVVEFAANSNYSSGSNRVVFSGGASWDDIQISFGPHYIPVEFGNGSNSLAGVSLPVGETIVEWIATDALDNQGACSFTVTVSDTQNPTVTAAEDVSGAANTGMINFQTAIPDAIFGDNCANPELKWAMTGAVTATGNGQVGSYTFPPGSTTITYTVTDAYGNTATDSLVVTNTYVQFSGGDGTTLNPFQIGNLQDLSLWSQKSTLYENSRFILINDIDASATQYWDDADSDGDGDAYNDENDSSVAGTNNGFRPIARFAGQLNGQGFVIDGLTINRSANRVAFIGEFWTGSITSVGMTNVSITGGQYVGALVSFNVGYISMCYSTGVVNANIDGGGLVGFNSSFVTNCYSRAAVSGNTSIGGLVGVSYGNIVRSYSTGAVAFSNSGGGFLGLNASDANCFWDVITSTQATSSGSAIGKTSAQMKTLSTFTAVGWDFVNETANGSADIWAINPDFNDGYPFFAVQVATSWTGAVNNDWETAGNWSKNEVPSANAIVTIPDALNDPLISSPTDILNLNILAGAEVNVHHDLTLKGDLNNEGAIIFKSDADASGHFGKFEGTIYGSGTAIVERYIPAKRAWRALTAPLKGNNGSLFANWQNNGSVIEDTGLEIWGPSGTGMAVGPGYSVLDYTAAGYVNVTNSQTKNLFETDKNNAFLVFVTGAYGSGNITTGAEATTLKATGSLITGSVNYTDIINSRHTMIGNPYASPLNPATLLDNATNLIDKFWVWDPNLGASGGYVMFDNLAGTYNNLTGSYPSAATAVQSGQAFFVRATTGNTGSLTLTEENKSNVFTNSVFSSQTPEIVRLGMYKQQGTTWQPLDGAIAVMYPNANPEVDVKDGRKFANTSENMAFRRNNISLSSEHHLPLVANDTLYFRIWNTSPNAYKLHLNTESFTTTALVAKLQDLFTNTDTILNLDGTTVVYPFQVTSDANSTNDRFRIVFQDAVALGTETSNMTNFVVAPNPVVDHLIRINFDQTNQGEYQYKLINLLGQAVVSGKVNSSSDTTINVSGVASGYYVLQLQSETKDISTIKVIIK